MRATLSLAFILWAIGLQAQNSQVYCRYVQNTVAHYGKVTGKVISELDKAPWAGGRVTGKKVALNSIKLLNPSQPQVIIGLAKSYKNSWKGKTPFKTVRWFIKPPGSAGSPGADVILPAALDEVKVEVEMVIVIGKKVKNAGLEEAGKAIFGYTIGNDIVGLVDSYHRVQGEPLNQPEKVLATGLKIGDGFEPFGPFIFVGGNWKNRKKELIITSPDGKQRVRFQENTSNLLYSPAKIVSDLSRVLTLSPGDIISTGTGKSFIAGVGDSVSLSIEGYGKFSFKIVKP